MMTSLIQPRAAGVVPARLTATGWQVLVVRAPRAWEFPNGSVEPGDDPELTARRHTTQSTGIADLRFPFGPVYRDPAPNSRGRYPRYYVAVTEQKDVTLTPPGDEKRPEHHEARWVSLDDAAALLPQRLGPVLSWARRMLDKA